MGQITISQLPSGTLPLPSGAVFPMDPSPGGTTQKATLAQLAAFIAAGQGGYTVPTSDLTTTGGTGGLPATGGNVYVHNSGSAVLLIPPVGPMEGLSFIIFDADGTAGNFPISFQATIAGVVNPVIIDVNYATQLLQFHSGNWYRIK